MIVYHGLWDAVCIFGAHFPWYRSQGAHIWQQMICMTFILVSGFCWPMGSKHVKKGALVIVCSVIISLVTACLMPENIILFGVLSLMGSCMLIMIPLDVIYSKLNSYVGVIISLLLFILTKKINGGVVGIGDITFFEIP